MKTSWIDKHQLIHGNSFVCCVPSVFFTAAKEIFCTKQHVYENYNKNKPDTIRATTANEKLIDFANAPGIMHLVIYSIRGIAAVNCFAKYYSVLFVSKNSKHLL